MSDVLLVAKAKLKSNGRIVINAILLETACTAVDELKKFRLQRYRRLPYFGCERKANKQRHYDDGEKSHYNSLSDETLGEN